MPCSTWTRARAAPSIQSTVRPSARRVELGGEIEIADQRRRAGHDEQQIFNEAAESAEEVDGLLLAVGAGAVGLGGMEELRNSPGPAERGAEKDEGILAAGEVGGEIDGEGAADGAFGEPGSKGAVMGLELGAALRRGALRDRRRGWRRGDARRRGSGWWEAVPAGFP